MINTQNFKTISLITLGMAALSATNPSQSYGQGKIYETTANLNLREGVGTNYNIILTMKKGSKLEIIEYLGAWAKVKYNGYVGYVSKQYLKEVESTNTKPNTESQTSIKTMRCTGDSVNVRTGPSTSERVIGKLNKGDKVQVIYTTSNGWSRVKYKNNNAYVSAQYLTEETIEKPSKEETSAKVTKRKCTATILNVRSGPSTKNAIVGKLKKGDIVVVVYEVNTGWTKIEYNGGYAYVSKEYLADI